MDDERGWAWGPENDGSLLKAASPRLKIVGDCHQRDGWVESNRGDGGGGLPVNNECDTGRYSFSPTSDARGGDAHKKGKRREKLTNEGAIESERKDEKITFATTNSGGCKGNRGRLSRVKWEKKKR